MVKVVSEIVVSYISKEYIHDAWSSDFSVVATISFAWKLALAACPTSCSALMVGCKGTVHARCCHWLASSAAFTAKVAAWPTVHESSDGHRADLSWCERSTTTERKLNWTEASNLFNRKSHVIAQIFRKINMNPNHFKLPDGKSRMFCRPAKNLHGPVPVRGLAVENRWSKLLVFTSL